MRVVKFSIWLMTLALPVETQGQPTAPFVFRRRLNLSLTPIAPTSIQSPNNQLRLDIIAHDGFPATEACFVSDSTLVANRDLRIPVQGRKRCSGLLLAGSYSPSLGIPISVPLAVHLILPGASAVFRVISKNVVLGAFEIVVDHPAPRLHPPVFPIARFPWAAAFVEYRRRCPPVRPLGIPLSSQLDASIYITYITECAAPGPKEKRGEPSSSWIRLCFCRTDLRGADCGEARPAA